jgi:hypothetical protein
VATMCISKDSLFSDPRGIQSRLGKPRSMKLDITERYSVSLARHKSGVSQERVAAAASAEL